MKSLRFVFLMSILYVAVLGAAQNNTGSELGAIQGTITRAGKGEPLEGATVTLQGGGADPQAIQTLLNTAASQGIVITPAPGATTRDIVQSLATAAQARGIPLTVANLQSQLASLRVAHLRKQPPNGKGALQFATFPPAFIRLRFKKMDFYGNPEVEPF